MWSDEQGRDISDRLAWQWEVQKAWKGMVRIPDVYDLFKVDGDSYLALEYIKGKSLLARIQAVSYTHLVVRLK